MEDPLYLSAMACLPGVWATGAGVVTAGVFSGNRLRLVLLCAGRGSSSKVEREDPANEDSNSFTSRSLVSCSLSASCLSSSAILSWGSTSWLVPILILSLLLGVTEARLV